MIKYTQIQLLTWTLRNDESWLQNEMFWLTVSQVPQDRSVISKVLIIQEFESHYTVAILRRLLVNYNFVVFCSPSIVLFFSFVRSSEYSTLHWEAQIQELSLRH